jgi:hypothetical protein
VRPIAYLTDVEGDWHKIADFCADNPLVTLSRDPRGDRLEVARGAVFVFGGDAVDRGPWSRRIVRLLLRAVREQPEQVVLLAGNRDINKLRLPRELGGFPPARTPGDARAAGGATLLRWIMDNTMGARQAFEHRRTELGVEGRPTGDDDVVASFLEDVAEDGELLALLRACRVGFREGRTMFVHGGVTEQNLFIVPNAPDARDADAWIAALDRWYAEQLAVWERDPMSPGDALPPWWSLISYQAPLPGTRANEGSVVYGRTADALNNPELPPRSVIGALASSGITRVVVGHTPMGDTPALLRDEEVGFELLFADNAHARLPSASRITIVDDHVEVRARTQLDDGGRHESRYRVAVGERSPIGKRIEGERFLVKGPLPGDRYELFRYHAGYRSEQIAIGAAELSTRSLVAARTT